MIRRSAGVAMRDGWRSLRTHPVLSCTAIASLALGMGGVTALFSLVNAAMLRPLPVHEPHQLVHIATDRSDSFPAAVWADIRDRRILPDAFAWVFTPFDTATSGEQQPADGLMVSGNTFAVLGVRPWLGRLVEAKDDRPGGGPDGRVAVISHAFWQRRFGGDPDIIGRTLTLNREPFTVVGVTGPSFRGLYGGLGFDVAIALEVAPERFYRVVMGRLGPGDSVEALTAALQAVQPAIRTTTLPPTMAEPYRTEYLSAQMTVRPAPAGVSFLARRYSYPLQVLLAISGLLLLLACGNIALLQIGRGQQRRRELSIRAAVGADGGTLVALCLAESAILAASGLLVGLFIARAAIDLILVHLSTQAFDIVLDVSPDWRMAAFAATLVGLTTAAFGVAPAWRAARVDPTDALRTRLSPPGVPRVGWAVIAIQATASVVLLASMVPLVRSFVSLASVSTGFDTERVVVVEIDTPTDEATSPVRSDGTSVPSMAHLNALLDAVATAPGIEAAGLSNSVPAGNSATTPWLELVDGTKLASGVEGGVFSHQVSPGWLRTYGTRIVAGRGLTLQDRAGSPRVALVNRTFVDRFLRGQSPLGLVLAEREHPAGPAHDLEIVGVVEDAIYRMLREDVPPTVYTAFAQHTGFRFPTLQLSIRPQRLPDAAVRRQIASVLTGADPNLSFRMRTLEDQVAAQMRLERLLAALSTAFAGLGVLLAAVGLYGIVAWTVEGRRVELGIRAALGAPRPALTRLIVGQTAVALGVGLVAGALVSSATSSLLRSLLFGVEANDWVTVGGACGALVTVAAVAVVGPTWRAVRVEPGQVLRQE